MITHIMDIEIPAEAKTAWLTFLEENKSTIKIIKLVDIKKISGSNTKISLKVIILKKFLLCQC